MSALFLAGLINTLFIPWAIWSLWQNNGRLPFFSTPISHARTTHTKINFILYVLIACVIEVAFLFAILSSQAITWSTATLYLPFLGFFSLAATGLTTKAKHKGIHAVAAAIFILTFTIWSFFFHFDLITVNTLFGYLGLSLSLIALIGVPYLFWFKKSIGWSELLFAAITIIWNVLMSVLIYFYL